MQNSELYRRGVVLPLNASAEHCLRHNDIDTTIDAKYLKIDGDEQFETLWELDLFQKINECCGSLLDDYEEDFVESRYMTALANVLCRIKDNQISHQPTILSFLDDLQEMVDEAASLDRPLLFVL